MNIFRPWISLLAGVSILTVSVAAHFNKTDYDLSDVRESLVQVADFCSGVVIPDPITSDGIQYTVLTAAHCVSDMKLGQQIMVKPAGESTSYAFHVQDFNTGFDLAILQMDGKDTAWEKQTEPANVSKENLEPGDDVWVASYPEICFDPLGHYICFDLGEFWTHGIASRIQWVAASWIGMPYLQIISAWTESGSSGSPIFGFSFDGGYELYNILTGGTYLTPYSTTIPATTIQMYFDLLNTNQVASAGIKLELGHPGFTGSIWLETEDRVNMLREAKLRWLKAIEDGKI